MGTVVDSQSDVPLNGSATPPAPTPGEAASGLPEYTTDGKAFRGWIGNEYMNVTHDMSVYADYQDRYVVSEDHDYDIILSGGDVDGYYLDYYETL